MIRLPYIIRPFGFLLVLLWFLPGVLHGQTLPQNPQGLTLERSELMAMLERYEDAASSNSYSGRFREQARREAELIRTRLEQGDFRVGDRVDLRVREAQELTGEFTVQPGQILDLPTVGPISLSGVLRAELEDHLEKELGRFLQDPTVSAQSMIRLSLTGSVNTPGFYVIPASALLGDAIMQAGGPTGTANMDELRIRRGDQVVWEGEALQEALVEGRTLDQLSMRAGDQIVVPAERPGFFSGGVVRTLLITLPPLILIADRIFR